jgi:hypothetical protein
MRGSTRAKHKATGYAPTNRCHTYSWTNGGLAQISLFEVDPIGWFGSVANFLGGQARPRVGGLVYAASE